jgi:mannosyltransferase OCH1-like enzyme
MAVQKLFVLLHDDDAIDRLLNKQDWPEFPHIKTVASCITSPTAKADLWRYLVLWEYGGIYTDLDSIPNIFNASSITAEDDSFFVVEQGGWLSQYFMAASPRHPLMYFAIQKALTAIIIADDTGALNAAFTTGPRALVDGWEAFMRTVGVTGVRKVEEKQYVGYQNRSVTVVGSDGRASNLYVRREAIGRDQKKREYELMNMTHFHNDRHKSLTSCYTHMLATHLSDDQ